MRATVYTSSAIGSGILLSLLIFTNGLLGEATHPVWSSFMIHGLGAIVATICIIAVRPKVLIDQRPPLWSYFGGVFGASTVILSNITSVSALGVSGTIALVLFGQIIMGAIGDHLGWFGLVRRPITAPKLIEMTAILAGSLCIILGARG